ncbi:S41 family peptidase [Nannocystis sp.]|uniref:S41 family peptidase n=1 Tax=Nannocystis sp. TaxID=1962667 RepID=UPI002425A4A6|nr:S41 family peptidase [Nannocystis sp.]MBK7825591.1 hypothetical protein [Nannocystis sp.]MBK9756699.1 hypothetical protein [Nannocystis sp.]
MGDPLRCDSGLAIRPLLALIVLSCGPSDPHGVAAEPDITPPACELAANLRAWQSDNGAAAIDVAPIADSDPSCTLAISTPGLRGIVDLGLATRELDVAAYRGKRIRAHAELQVVPDPRSGFSLALLGLQAHGATPHAAQDDLLDGPAGAWRSFDICMDVPPDAQDLTLELTQTCRSVTRLRRLDVDIVDAAPPTRFTLDESIHEKHLAVLARAFGHLRYFYPAHASTRAWHQLAADGVTAIAPATTPTTLIAALNEWVEQIGPDIEFSQRSGDDPPQNPAAPGWHHHGVAGARSLFRSEFTPPLNDPPGLVDADIGLGLRIRYPRAFAGEPTPRSLPPRPASSPCAALDNPGSQRLATVISVWALLNQFYPYHAVMRSEWDHALTLALPAAAKATTQTDLLHVLRRMLANLHDGHARVFHAAQRPCALPLQWRWIGEQIVITATPDTSTGLAIGDVVEQIDGVDAARRLADALAEVSAATTSSRHDLALRLLREEPTNPTTTLLVTNPAGRHSVDLPCTAGPQPAPHRDPVESLADDIIILRGEALNPRTLATEAARIADAAGIVIDLRGSTSAHSAAPVVPHLLDTPVLTPALAPLETRSPDPGGVTLDELHRSTITPVAPRWTAPVAFLIDERAISAAESDLAPVHEHHLAPIFGATTAGTTCDINEVWFPDSFRVRWTGCLAFTSDGMLFHGLGITPTHPVAPTVEGIRAGRDEVLEAALAWLAEQH